MPRTKIDTSSSGENSIVAAGASNQAVRVLSYKLVAAGSVTVQWMDGTTEMEGPCSMIVGVPHFGVPCLARVGAGISDRFVYYETTPGNALQLNLGSGVQVSGYVEWTYDTR